MRLNRRSAPGLEGVGTLGRSRAWRAWSHRLTLAALPLAVVAAPVATAQASATPTTVTFVQRNAVHELRPCLGSLSAADRQLIVVQFGIGGKPIPTIAAAAAQLGETPNAEYRQVVYSLRRMEARAHRGLCRLAPALPGAASTAKAAPAAAAETAGSASGGAKVAAATPPLATVHAASASHRPEIVAAVLLLLLLAVVVALLSRRRRLGVATANSPAGRSESESATRRRKRLPNLDRRGPFVREIPRDRRYVSRASLTVLSPLFRHSLTRDAYVLRGVGNRFGPVLREDRRRHKLPIDGPDRRQASAT